MQSYMIIHKPVH